MTKTVWLSVRSCLWCCLLLALFRPANASADAVPPDQAACHGAEEGDRCPDGRCEKAKCQRQARPVGDASVQSPPVEYDCMVCVEHDDGGCSASPGGLAGNLAPWILAGSVALFVLHRKRER